MIKCYCPDTEFSKIKPVLKKERSGLELGLDLEVRSCLCVIWTDGHFNIMCAPIYRTCDWHEKSHGPVCNDEFVCLSDREATRLAVTKLLAFAFSRLR